MPALLADIAQLVVLTLAVLRFVAVPLIRYLLGMPIPLRELGARLRNFLDDSGLIYRKLGQYLAMRSDLLPPAICAELDFLFEGAVAMPFSEIERIIEEELGRPWQECYASFDPQPVGSASVAQVHRATALDGERLAVKVQRRGIRREFEAAVRVFGGFAGLSDFFRLTGTLYLKQLFDEFAVFTEQELDFELEGRTADRLRKEMSPHGDVPTIRWDLTTTRLLSMQFIEGESFLTICRLSEAGRSAELAEILRGIDFHEVVSNLADECFNQLFTTGFFHGDPHPGNVILRKDGVFTFLDFGISGELSDQQRNDLAGFVENLALGKLTSSAFYYTRLCELSPSTDVDAWMDDVTAALASWYAGLSNPDAPIESRHMGQLQGKITVAMRRHNVLNRPKQLLVWRALVLLDTTTLRLPIRFDLLAALGSFFLKRHGNLAGLVRRALRSWREEAPTLDRAYLLPVRRLLVGANSKTTVIRYRTAAGTAATSSLLCAILGVACGGIAANAGGGTVSSLGVLASAGLLLLALRK
jgi:ubiquinone biosynthesis protein